MEHLFTFSKAVISFFFYSLEFSQCLFDEILYGNIWLLLDDRINYLCDIWS